jgi:acetyl-CoA C-acetyltransferase
MRDLKDIVAVSAVRTPMGRFGGTLRATATCDLGAAAMRAAVGRAGLRPEDVDDVIFGSCRQAGNGPNPARTAAVRAGVPLRVPSITLNRACPSGRRAVAFAAQAIRVGEASVVLAGGMDSMSTIPYLLKDCRWDGFKMGNRELLDGWSDSIDPLIGQGMGETAENLAGKYGISREDQDRYAASSHAKAAAAWDAGLFADEVISVEVPEKGKSAPAVFDRDETFRRELSLEKMAGLKPAFRQGGTVTAGNACGMSDGAAALVLTSREEAGRRGLKPIFSVVAYAQAAVAPEVMGEGPAVAIPMALERAGMELSDMDLIEVNEAFAVQVLANGRTLQWDWDRVNVNGGAIALGHPTGISGARILVTLQNALRSRNGELGVASICGGGGVTTAMVIRREN